MSTAVLISGQMRTFADCVANQNWMVYRHLEDPVFFISCADDEQARDAYILEQYFPGRVHVEIVKQPDVFENMPSFDRCRHAPYAPTPNRPEVVLSIMRQLWHYKRVWQFFMTCGLHPANDVNCRLTQFDTYVRMRPDLWFHRFTMPCLWRIHEDPRFLFVGPWKSTCGGVNDRFSVMGIHAAKAYFNAIGDLQEVLSRGCPLHPESIQAEVLNVWSCIVKNTLDVEFTCVRLPGRGEHVPLREYPGELSAYLADIK